MENSDDDNDEETDKHAMLVETSDKSGPETPKQTMKTSDENDQESSSHVDVCKICGKSFHSKYYLDYTLKLFIKVQRSLHVMFVVRLLSKNKT